ncbi:MAG: hypothetical protein ABJF23_01365 [Bryobacteraceae bacterium]
MLISISGKKDFLTRGLLAIAAAQHPAAFMPWLQTHKVDLLKPPEGNRPPDPSKEEVIAFDVCKKQVEFGQQCPAPDTATYMVKRKRLNRVVRTNPIWTMAVPRDIISAHGDVWNPGYLNFQLNMIASHNPDEAGRQSRYVNGRVKMR